MIPYLTELRTRVIRVLVIFGVLAVIFSFFANRIYQWFAWPLLKNATHEMGLIATSVPAPFLIPFKSAMILAFFLIIPYVLYQFWCFLAPALYQKERKLLWFVLLSSTALFYIGVVFAYVVVLPILFKFFSQIAPIGVEVKPDIGEYFSFIVSIFLSFGVAFEIPIVIVVLVALHICSRDTLAKKRSYVIVGSFIVAMLLTPPDVVSQILLAIPLWGLFELGLVFSKLVTNTRTD
jgi:sec-independent protein translocase protein TatC